MSKSSPPIPIASGRGGLSAGQWYSIGNYGPNVPLLDLKAQFAQIARGVMPPSDHVCATARPDFILGANTGALWREEVDAIAGRRPESAYPRNAACARAHGSRPSGRLPLGTRLSLSFTFFATAGGNDSPPHWRAAIILRYRPVTSICRHDAVANLNSRTVCGNARLDQ